MAERPRIQLRTGRVVVLRYYHDRYSPHPWMVWNGWRCVARYATHAEAIAAADKRARAQVGKVGTDSRRREDYGYLVG